MVVISSQSRHFLDYEDEKRLEEKYVYISQKCMKILFKEMVQSNLIKEDTQT